LSVKRVVSTANDFKVVKVHFVARLSSMVVYGGTRAGCTGFPVRTDIPMCSARLIPNERTFSQYTLHFSNDTCIGRRHLTSERWADDFSRENGFQSFQRCEKQSKN